MMVANAIGMADLVIIPTQGSAMDAKGGAKTVRLIRNQERMARRPITHSVLLTRTSAAVTSRSLRNVQEQLAKAGVNVFITAIVERAAFRDIFDFGGTLATLDPKTVSDLNKATGQCPRIRRRGDRQAETSHPGRKGRIRWPMRAPI